MFYSFYLSFFVVSTVFLVGIVPFELKLPFSHEQIERQVTEVNRMRATLRKTKSLTTKSAVSNKDRDKANLANRKQQKELDAAKREAARAKRMVELMRQLGTVLRQVCPGLHGRIDKIALLWRQSGDLSAG
jgi:hypothetical protein